MKTSRENSQSVLFPKSTGSSKKGGVRKRGKAPTLSPEQSVEFLQWTTTTWWPTRDAVVALLSFECAMRSIEIARVEWGMAFDASWRLRSHLKLHNFVSKGGYGAREARITPGTLGVALERLRYEHEPLSLRDFLVDFRSCGVNEYSRSRVIQAFFRAGYDAIGLDEHSSHSGRRTAITQMNLKLGLPAAQKFAGHRNASTTAGYVDTDQRAVDRVVEDCLAVRLPVVLKMATATLESAGKAKQLVSDRTPKLTNSLRQTRRVS